MLRKIGAALLGAALAATLAATPAHAEPAPATQARQIPAAEARELALANEDLKERCENQESALGKGWFPDRYTMCQRKYMIIDVFDERNVPVGDVRGWITILGFGNNGAREFNYLVYIEDIVKDAAPTLALDAVVMDVWFSICNPAGTACDFTANRAATVAEWKLVDFFAVTMTSPDIAGGGDQILPRQFTLMHWMTTPGQPFIGGPAGRVATSNVRYDSAGYVGRARGAVFTDHKLVLELSLSDPLVDESALHIRHAVDFPYLTFPSWLGKSVPGEEEDGEPLTRMYNESQKNANRTLSEKTCKELWGEWDSNLVNCDEFPFASTYEGARTSTDANNGLQRFSVRLIDATDNKYVGNQLLEVDFYRALRVLDGDKFYVSITR